MPDIALGNEMEGIALGKFFSILAHGVGNRYKAGHAIKGLAGEGILAAGGFFLIEINQFPVFVGNMVILLPAV
jgi:hypothetical protein